MVVQISRLLLTLTIRVHLSAALELGLFEYRDFQDANEQIGRFIDDVYARKRIHSSLGYLTPAEFEQQWRAAK